MSRNSDLTGRKQFPLRDDFNKDGQLNYFFTITEAMSTGHKHSMITRYEEERLSTLETFTLHQI